MKQSRILDLLSLGLITDVEASLQLTGGLPSAGAPQLSGTFFRPSTGTDPNAVNPYSNTTTGGNGGGLSQAITPNTPKKAKS